MREIVLQTIDLSKRFGDILAVDSVSLSVRCGEVYGFLGPNGSGKTTTIGMILGLLHPTSGRVELFGTPVSPRAVSALHAVGSLVGAPAMIPDLTARANLALLAQLSPGMCKNRVSEVLEAVGLSEAEDRRVKGFSLGMQQRLGLAAALIHSPDLLVLDEPTNGLDPSGMREMRELLRNLADAGVTVFVSSHLLHEVEQVCDRVAVLNHGKVVSEGRVSELLGGQSVVHARVPSPAKAADVLRALPGVVEVRPNGHFVDVVGPSSEAVNLHLVQNGIVPSELTHNWGDLESVFLALTQESD